MIASVLPYPGAHIPNSELRLFLKLMAEAGHQEWGRLLQKRIPHIGPFFISYLSVQL
jgi:hypothetical protein